MNLRPKIRIRLLIFHLYQLFTQLLNITRGKIGLAVLFIASIIFLSGLFLGSIGSNAASSTAIIGMIIYFLGGLW